VGLIRFFAQLNVIISKSKVDGAMPATLGTSSAIVIEYYGERSPDCVRRKPGCPAELGERRGPRRRRGGVCIVSRNYVLPVQLAFSHQRQALCIRPRHIKLEVLFGRSSWEL
jgi:hypothetical protein